MFVLVWDKLVKAAHEDAPLPPPPPVVRAHVPRLTAPFPTPTPLLPPMSPLIGIHSAAR